MAIASQMHTVVKSIKAVAITAATPVSVWNPNALVSGLRFVVLGWSLSLSSAGSILFEDGTGNEVFRTPLLAAAGISTSPFGFVYEAGSASAGSGGGNALFLDVTVSGSVSGVIFGYEQ